MTSQTNNENRFHSALEFSGVSIWERDLSCDTVVYSPEWKRIRGYGNDWECPDPLDELALVHPDDRAKVHAHREQLISGQAENYSLVYRTRHSNGSDIWVEERARGICDSSGTVVQLVGCEIAKEYDEAGNVTGYVGTVADVSKMKPTEEGIEQLRRRFLNVLECSSIGIWEWGFEKEELVWDEQMFKIHGVEKADFRGKFEDWTDRLHPDDFVRATTEDTCRTEQIGTNGTEFRIVRPNGDVRNIYCWVYHEKDEHGQPNRAVGLNLDITDRRQAEHALLESENKFQRVAEGVPGMIGRYLVSADGSRALTYASPQCRELFELEPEDAVNDVELSFNRVHPDDVPSVEEAIRNSIENHQPLKIEYRVLLPKKGLRWLQTVARPSRLEDGTTAFDAFILDITERKEIELANDFLAKATKTKDEFIANMSHELRTPLSAILAMTEGLQQGIFGKTTPQQLESLNVVEKSGLHLLELINEVLDLAKIESGQVELNLSQIDLSQLCASGLSLVSQQAENKSIELILNLSNDLPKFVGDEKLLRQILINLLSNSVKFTPENGQVTIKMVKLSCPEKDASDILQISIADNGIGIKTDKLNSLFEPFVQVESSLNRRYEGTGLGLSLVKQFVELHHGSIRVESKVGAGSCFIVELPFLPDVADELAEATGKLQVPRHQDGSMVIETDMPATILMAEDNDCVAQAITALLESVGGYQVYRAVNGKEAVDHTRAKNPNLILMDIQMPVMDGLEAIRQIRAIAQFAQTPIIALSGFAMPEDSSRCINAGANKFISKPCPMPKLLAEIKESLDSHLLLTSSNKNH